MKVAALALLVVAAPVAARDTLGVFGRWGAFRDAQPARCFAIARPIEPRGRSGGFASVASWPGRGVRSAISLRLSRPRDASLPVTLTIGERRFALAGSTTGVWAADPASDRAIVAAMRGGRSMSVEAVAPRGHPFADVYALAGAATAIDAAALGCVPAPRATRLP